MRADGAIEACSSPRRRRGHDLAHSLVVFFGVVVMGGEGPLRDIALVVVVDSMGIVLEDDTDMEP